MCQQNNLRGNKGQRVYVLIYFLVLVLSGCANQQVRTDIDNLILWEIHRNRMAGINHWELAGRMAVRLDGESWSASLFWKQAGDNFEIRIIAPLAQGTALITGDGDRINLKTSDNREFSDSDVLQIMNENLGWSIPVDDLKYWVRGIARPGYSIQKTDINENGRLSTIQEENWVVSFQRYDLTTENALPSRIELTRPGARIRIVINRWDVTSS